jgi:hypothetical protein
MYDVPQRGDALQLLQSLPASSSPLVIFDPEFRGPLDRLKFGNEGERQRGRASLPPMSESYIDAVCSEIARVKGRGQATPLKKTAHGIELAQVQPRTGKLECFTPFCRLMRDPKPVTSPGRNAGLFDGWVWPVSACSFRRNRL